MLSSRQKKIISYILDNKEFVTIKKLSDHFHLSERSIQYDLENIEYFAEQFGVNVVRNKNLGVKIKTKPSFKMQLLNEDVTEVVLTPKERQERILLLLFETLQPISSNNLANQLFVTRRTIVEDMKEVREWLHDRSLNLSYVKNKGFSIKGEERNYREAYVEALVNHCQSQAFPLDLKILEAWEIALIQRSVDHVLVEENYNIVQPARDGLVFHIAITIHRVRNQYQITMPDKELEKFRCEREFLIAKRIKQTVEEKFSLKFPESEIGYITLHLLGAKQAAIEQNKILREDISFVNVVREFITNVSGRVGVNLTLDVTLFRGLIVHLRPAIYRLQYDMRNPNPLKEEIINRYPDIIGAVNSNLLSLENQFQVKFSDDEAAYLALHIGAAMERAFEKRRPTFKAVLMCASGVGTSQLLKSKIEKYYPEIVISDVFSIYTIGEDYFCQNKIDLVISTIPTPEFSIPVIQVSPFLNNEDRYNLNQYLNIEREKMVETSFTQGPVLNKLLTPECIQWNIDAKDWKHVIRISASLLEAKSIVETKYSDAIIREIKRHGPYMVIYQGIALPHASPSDGVHRPGISIVKLNEPISFGHPRFDPVWFVICLAPTDAYTHLNALRQLIVLLQDINIMKQIKEGDKKFLLKLIDQVSQL